jgi:hypothetical protein
MADYKLDYIHDPDKQYRIRGCVRVDQLKNPVEGSIQVPCDECGDMVWINPNQKVPEHPHSRPVDGDITLCMDCLRFHISIDADEPLWAGPKPPGFD